MYLVSLSYGEAAGSWDTPMCICSTEDEAKDVVAHIRGILPSNSWRFTVDYEFMPIYENNQIFKSLLEIRVRDNL